MGRCLECDSALSFDQRYCVVCGAARKGIPSRLGQLITAIDIAPAPVVAGVPPMLVAPPTNIAPGGVVAAFESLLARGAPSPRVLAVAVCALLAFGVLIGGLIGGTGAQLWMLPSPAPVAQATPVSAPAAPQAAGAPELPAVVAQQQAAPVVAPTQATGEPAVEIKHIWLIVLSGQGWPETFGDAQSQAYLTKELAGQGVLFENYNAVASGSLANSVALVSGQQPTAEQSANCPSYSPIGPGAADPANFGQVDGAGCVYPESTRTIGDALTALGKSWAVYAEDAVDPTAGRSSACQVPATGGEDTYFSATPDRRFTTWSNPFLYFSSLAAGANCAFTVFGTDALESDLKAAKSPNFSLVIPNRCNSGSDTGCGRLVEPGLAGSDDFLKRTVGAITASKDYADGGLIAITFDAAGSSTAGPTAATGATGQTGETGQTGVATAVAAAGEAKKVGLLLLSPLALAGSIETEGSYDHYSLLASISTWLGVEKLGQAQAPAVKLLPGSSIGLKQ